MAVVTSPHFWQQMEYATKLKPQSKRTTVAIGACLGNKSSETTKSSRSRNRVQLLLIKPFSENIKQPLMMFRNFQKIEVPAVQVTENKINFGETAYWNDAPEHFTSLRRYQFQVIGQTKSLIRYQS